MLFLPKKRRAPPTAALSGGRRWPFNGSIDEIMIFDRALTAEEVQVMYQNFAQYKQ